VGLVVVMSDDLGDAPGLTMIRYEGCDVNMGTTLVVLVPMHGLQRPDVGCISL